MDICCRSHQVNWRGVSVSAIQPLESFGACFPSDSSTAEQERCKTNHAEKGAKKGLQQHEKQREMPESCYLRSVSVTLHFPRSSNDKAALSRWKISAGLIVAEQPDSHGNAVISLDSSSQRLLSMLRIPSSERDREKAGERRAKKNTKKEEITNRRLSIGIFKKKEHRRYGKKPRQMGTLSCLPISS